MIMPQGLILPFVGNYADIPANWTQETTLVDKFLKAWGTANPNDTGGATAHSHVGNSHSHSETDSHGHVVQLNTSADCASYGGSPNQDPIAQCGHGHASSTITTRSGGQATSTVAYPSTANNNHPPYVKAIFIKAGVGAVLADGIITLWNSATIPDGYLMCSDGLNGAPALGNKYLRGASLAGDGGATGGSLTHTHDLSHSHSTSHSHSGLSGTDDNHPVRTNGGGSGGNKTGSHQHTVYLNAQSVTTDTYSATLTSADLEPVYKKLIALYKNGGAVKKGMIGIWIGSLSAIPKGWLLCNGQVWSDGVTYTPDLQNYFIKIANATGELGATGGANSHSHGASNSHSHSQSGAHTHTGSTDNQGGSTASGGSTSPASHNHSLQSVGNNNATLTWDAQTMSAESVSNEPDHVVVAFIQLEKIQGSRARILNV